RRRGYRRRRYRGECREPGRWRHRTGAPVGSVGCGARGAIVRAVGGPGPWQHRAGRVVLRRRNRSGDDVDGRAVIEFENVGHTYDTTPVVSDVDLRLEQRRVAFVGANGSGKSTVARMINGLVVPSRGRVRVNGLDTASEGRKVRKQVGF